MQAHVAIFGQTAERIQQANDEAAARLWLIARALDERGAGRASVDQLRTLFVRRWQLMTWRRLRQIMDEGEERFWQRGTGRHGTRWLYYRSETRVLHAYGATAVYGYGVAVPVEQLVAARSIRPLRQLFYDAAHSARQSLSGYTAPIARETLAAITGTSAHTQRRYELARGIEAQATYAIIGRYNAHTLAAEHAADSMGDARPGGPAFPFIDYHDRLQLPCSPANTSRPSQRVYLARQLGNTYSGTLQLAPRSKRHANYRLHRLRHNAVSAGCQSAQGTVQKRYHALALDALEKRRRRAGEPGPLSYTDPQRVNQTRFFLEKTGNTLSAVSVGSRRPRSGLGVIHRSTLYVPRYGP
jgi:hypothetical protein